MLLLQNINKYYYTDTSVTQALRKINLEFQTGEFVAITGESGSGKSTLLNVISGMDTFDDGELYFDGEPTFQFDASDWEEFQRNRIGFVFQDYHLIGQYSVLDNVISALIIMGFQKDEAREKAKHYLEQVGLAEFEQQKTSELSSGQKQRLSIARALAKDTSIIVADEPTGNLDSETGEQIIALLKKVSKDKLVIMVTHNFEQAEPYVTRKIRLHDGEVVVDVQVNGTEPVTNQEEKKAEEKTERPFVPKEENRKQQNRIALFFAGLNSRTQRGRALLFRIFFFFTAAVSFVFIGQLYKNADDTFTKDYDTSVYCQKNDSRLSVRRKDGGALSSKDIQKMQSVRNVVQVDQYDYANDINYYTEEGKDYEFSYSTINAYDDDWGGYQTYAWEGPTDVTAQKTPQFLNKKKFMKSITCISKEDLSKGRLPENRFEIVLYAEDTRKLNQEMEIYFTADNIMGEVNYYHHKFRVVGLLKQKTSQIYFHGDFCHMLSNPADGDQADLEYGPFLRPYMDYVEKDQFYVVVGDDLKGNHARASQNYILPIDSILPKLHNVRAEDITLESALAGEDRFTLRLNTQRKGYSKELEKRNGQPVMLKVSGKSFQDQSGLFLEVSEEFFQKYFSRGSTQASVYIKNYTKTDSVIRALKKLGYVAVSTYRISSIDYNSQKVMDRLIFLSISVGILLALIFVEILILRSMMKIKMKDYYVYQSMGMRLGIMKRINYYEMSRYCLEAMAVTILLMLLLNLSKIPLLNSMMIYYGGFAYGTFFLYNFGLECITVWFFNCLLKGRMRS